MNPMFAIDLYKPGHFFQNPKGIKRAWVNWTPRSSRRPQRQGAIHLGLQYLITEYLEKQFKEEFFDQPLSKVIGEYKEVIGTALNIKDPETDHIAALHGVGYLPLTIYSLPEGAFVPNGVPAMVLANTDERFPWIHTYLETLISNILWMPSTSATTASIYREIFESAAIRFGEKNLSFVDWQGHDFSMRGLCGLEAAMLSGMGHLTNFSGTDSVPAILGANKYYSSGLNVGGSVPATEHSVMCAGGKENEFETFKRLITETYPTGIVSIVSDTWDLWNVLTNFMPRLKDIILARDGKIVIRPDSGDPESILCGKADSTFGPERAGVFRLLADCFGTDSTGHINKAGAIYGDSITIERATAITDRMVDELKLSPYNWVAGIGSYTYQYVTRDTQNFAMKETAIETEAGVIPIFKDPITDNSGKKSHRGIPVVYKVDGKYVVECGTDPTKLDNCVFRKVFKNGRRNGYMAFSQIRDNARTTWRNY